ncbi:B3 domain-containing protein At1g20600 [Striga asiatica]|uniref:B3 domain-containing protein At1g20600 n=1 Tax=Striga asiatica TaxID=4170 RepID=A0A5A7PKV8_STRAF|nr:B3 domain-containing protein At1g20600 [Striga asiatica]
MKKTRIDTSVRLSISAGRRHRRRLVENSLNNLGRFAQEVGRSTFLGQGPPTAQEILSPTPLRSFHPERGLRIFQDSDSDVTCKKRKREDGPGPSGSKPESGRKIGPHAQLSREFLMKIGPNPVFLFKKRLQASDVKGDQNRLFVKGEGRKKIEEGFLTEEERRRVWDTGIELYGVVESGEEYKLQLKKWWSLGLTVIKSGWCQMVNDNGVEAGDWVDVWGRRSPGGGGSFRLAFNFTAGGGERVEENN